MFSNEGLDLFSDRRAQSPARGGSHPQTHVREARGLREDGGGLHQELPQELLAFSVQQNDWILVIYSYNYILSSVKFILFILYNRNI